MKHLGTFYLLALFAAAPALAQVQVLDVAPATDREAALEGPRVLHVTDWLMRRPEGREALAEYRRLKEQGLLPYASKNAASAVGDTLAFRVINLKTSSFETRSFKLMAIADRFQIWAELAELDNGHVTQSNVDDLFTDLNSRTPQGSFNANAGIIVNDETVFGDPPNVDGDSKTDVLLVDVHDSYNPENVGSLFVAGFVSPNDLAGRGGNNRDVLYLDTFPSLTNPRFGLPFVAQTAAHEYQHLVHLSYDTQEEDFINEGLSEWAEVVNGYPGRRIAYLGDVNRYNVSFFRFTDTGDLDDRQRGLRFLSYLGDRFGVLQAGGLTRQSGSGTSGLRSALTAMNAGVTLPELLSDFHAANLLNNTALGARYGYISPEQLNIQATPSASFDGRLDAETPMTTATVSSGGVRYFVWDHVKDLALTLNGGAGSQNLQATAFLFQGSSFESRPLAFGTETFSGVFDRVAVVAAHVNPDAAAASLSYAATWNIEQQFQLETTVYDDGVVPRSDGVLLAFRLCSSSNPNLCNSVRLANRFVKPSNGILTGVTLGPYFDHDFAQSSAPPSAPRDFRLSIWAANGILGNGDLSPRPGDEPLFTLDVTDTRPGSGQDNNFANIIFLDVDLSAYQDQLAALPDTFYVGLTNTGADNNFVVMAVTSYDGNNAPENAVSYFYRSDFNAGEGLWARFDELVAGGEPILQNTVLPIRASFLVPVGPVAVEEAGEVPDGIVLYPNYPNPFNPATTIRYALPRADRVRLTVFDLLGRQVATLVDGLQAPGEHQVGVDASTWASGLYFYTIEAAGQRQTRRMVLVK